MEYNQTTGLVAPVLVDTGSVLNFSSSNLITGVNILEGLLYWTDNLNEPRVANIATFKAGSAQGGNTLSVTTTVYGRSLVASDITVMTPTPLVALTVTTEPSLVGGFGTGITPISTNVSNLYNKEVGDTQAFSWTAQNITWSGATNPRVILTASVTQEDGIVDQYQVSGVFASGSGLSPGGGLLTIESISSDTPNTSLVWSMILIEDEPIFKNDFPRFSYRYKYNDGKFSVYAPFSLAAFVPGKFEYLSRDGNNEGMKDVIRKITLSTFPTTPANVQEVEVLYKGSQSTNVYLIESFAYDFAANPQPVLTLEITSGVLGRVIESNQLLRLFDNVPQKAKAQELIGNRIVYGNYLQNYDVPNASIFIDASQTNSAHTNAGFGIATVKTDREYQLGVSFLDSFGRESPVFTSNGGAISFNQENSEKINILKGKLSASSTVPAWADYFKFYIKNISPEYYNIALDRYYSAQDGSVWLSFPSSERNKLKEGQYIRLKKQHDTSIPVTINNKYKITGLENEAPDYLTAVKTTTAANKILAKTNGFIFGNNKVKFYGPNNTPVIDGNTTGGGNESFYNGFRQGSSLQFINASGTGRSNIYEIIEGGPTGVVFEDNNILYSEYEALLTEGIKQSDTWLTLLNNLVPLSAAIIEETQRPLPEFQGRFFAKINPNATFTNNVSAAFASLVPEYVVDTEGSITQTAPQTGPSPSQLYWEDAYSGFPNPNGGLPVGVTFFSVIVVGYPTSATDAAKVFWDSLQPGARIKFKQSNGDVSNDFYIINSIVDGGIIQRQTNVPQGLGTAQRLIITIDRAYDDTLIKAYPPTIQIYRERIAPNQELLSSSNPAIFETEPEETTDLDLFYEASNAIAIGNATAVQTLSWFNAYSFGNGVESDRIRDDFNAPTLGKGVRVSSTLEEPYRQERLGSQMIFSGIFNSISGINNTNQFLTAENITKSLNVSYGTLQKLHARDTDLIALCEDKCFRILANKDALYNADGSTNVTASNNVLGQTVPFVGEYGISKNPESFASFGFRSYFADKARGTILRLSRDGLTDIGDKDMSFYFQDKLRTSTGAFVGSYDTDASSYNVAIGTSNTSFKESVDGWNTTLSYVPEAGVSLNNEYYTFKNGELYEHSNQTRSNFYGTQFNSTVTPIFNDAPTSIKNFKTLSYEGDEGWTADVTTNMQDGEVTSWKKKESLYFNFIKGKATTLANIDTEEFSVQGLGNVLSFNGTTDVVTLNGEVNISLQTGDEIYSTGGVVAPAELRLIGTVATINRVTNEIELTNTPPNPAPVAGNFVLFAKDSEVNTSGLLGYQATVKMTTTSSAKKELFAVNSEIFISSE